VAPKTQSDELEEPNLNGNFCTSRASAERKLAMLIFDILPNIYT